jgi:hypothetical protein
LIAIDDRSGYHSGKGELKMAKIAVKVEEDGIRIPLDAIQHLGLKPGDATCLNLSIASEAEAIQRAGMYYCWRKLGDALGVSLPIKQGDVWISELRLRSLPEPVGRLIYSADGAVLPDRSSSKQEIHEAIDAARSKAAAA